MYIYNMLPDQTTKKATESNTIKPIINESDDSDDNSSENSEESEEVDEFEENVSETNSDDILDDEQEEPEGTAVNEEIDE